MTTSALLCDTDQRGVATVTLNRPAVNNAYNAELVAALLDTFNALAGCADLRLVVIKGNGKHFQAGADLKWLAEVGAMDASANRKTSERTAALVRGLNEFPVPTIALVQGACIGGGTGIVASCDIVIASSDAKFAISEARWGAIASVIFPQLVSAIGTRHVRRLAVSCEHLGAHEAQRIGLVHEVCDRGQLDATAAPIIEGILRAGPEAVRQTKRCVMECNDDVMSDEVFDRLVQIHADKRQSAEATEGFKSFVEKRDPSWYIA